MDQLTQRSDDSSPPAEQGGTNTLQETPAATLQEALAVIANLQAQLTQAQTPEPVRQAPQQAPPTPAPSGSSEPENPGQIAAAITAALQGLQIPKTHAKTSSFQFPKDIPRFHNFCTGWVEILFSVCRSSSNRMSRVLFDTERDCLYQGIIGV